MEKYVKQLILSAQIDALVNLPYRTVYEGTMANPIMKTAIFMDDLMDVVKVKRKELSVLDGSAEIAKLKKRIEDLETIEEQLEQVLIDRI